MSAELKQIYKANIAKRIIAAIMDATVFIFSVLLLVNTVFSSIAESSFGYTENNVKGYEYQIFSKLYVLQRETSDGYKIINNSDELETISGESNYKVLHEYTFENVQEYKDRLEYYYCSFLTGQNLVFPKGAPELVLTRDLNGTNVSVQEWFNLKIAPLTDKEEIKNACIEAEQEFLNSSYMVEITSEATAIQIFMVLPPYVLCFGIFYVLIPLLFKDGETLGKKVMHIAIATKDGYYVQKRQIIFRQLILFIYTSFAILLSGNTFTAIAFLGFFILIYFGIGLLRKDKRSFADIAAYTDLIDSTKSVWFSSYYDEKRRNEMIDENMKQYKKNKVENKNVIQAGSKVIEKN